jgi:hypothetical protein
LGEVMEERGINALPVSSTRNQGIRPHKP